MEQRKEGPPSNADHLPIGIVAEAYQQCLALADRWRAEVTRWPKDVGGQCRIVGRGFLHVEGDGFLTAARNDLVVRASQRQGLGAADLAFDDSTLIGFDAILLQELLSLGAASSTVAMTKPLDFGGHAGSPREVPH